MSQNSQTTDIIDDNIIQNLYFEDLKNDELGKGKNERPETSNSTPNTESTAIFSLRSSSITPISSWATEHDVKLPENDEIYTYPKQLNDSNHRRQHLTFKQWLKIFWQESIILGGFKRWSAKSSIHGFSHAGNSQSRKTCLFWSTATVACFIGLTWFLQIRLNYYVNSGVVTSVDYEEVDSLELPDISVCVKEFS